MMGRPLMVALLLVAFVAAACQPAPPLPTLYPAPDFSLADQSGATVSRANYEGKVWLAGFIFTNCTDTCPLLTTRMVQIEQAVRSKGLADRVDLVSFTVDPVRDTPAVLDAYARGRGAGWRFLTGPEAAMRATVTGGFKIGYVLLPGSDQVGHGAPLLLIDRQGTVRGIYQGNDIPISRIVDDIERLARS